MTHHRDSPRRARGIYAAVALVLAFGAGKAHGVSYVGLGGGATPAYRTRIISYYPTEPETLRVHTGYGFEAQFGWEAAPWVDIEGALRYHILTSGDSAAYVLTTPTGHDIVGFEGGVRFHPRRGVTNSIPYVRLGLGSYSPTVKLNEGLDNLSTDPVLGYYAGIGYVYEVTSVWGIDLRASAVVYNAFNEAEHGIRLHAALVAVTLSVIIF